MRNPDQIKKRYENNIKTKEYISSSAKENIKKATAKRKHLI